MQVPLTKILQRIESLGGDARPLIFKDTAVYDDVYKIELQLTYKIPDDFKKVLLMVSSRRPYTSI